MSLKLGERARAASEYELILAIGRLPPTEGGYPEGLGEENRAVVERKLLEAPSPLPPPPIPTTTLGVPLPLTSPYPYPYPSPSPYPNP